jgi:hypothetical protein
MPIDNETDKPFTIPFFVQIAGDTRELFALDEMGDVWVYVHQWGTNKAHWEKLPSERRGEAS